MTAKIKEIYSCSKCGAQSSKWSGRCHECGAWGTMESEIKENESPKKTARSHAKPADIIDLKSLKEEDFSKMSFAWSEAERVLGGGIVPGSLILFSGEPGIGKSTMLAQIADKLSKNYKVLYISGEESAGQVKARLQRLNCSIENIKFVSETNLEKIASLLSSYKPDLAIVDSIQTIHSSIIESEPGNLSQIRGCASQFLEISKQENISVILIGHITKDGQVAGPKSLEHIVDTVLYLESDLSNNYTVLKSTKNRFGSTSEIGLFEMTGTGFRAVKESADIFISKEINEMSGSVISSVIEGTRPFLLDIQALVSKTIFGYPQRKSAGFDLNRLQVLTAVISKRTKLNLVSKDIILNIVGGLKMSDPALDLAVCLAIISSGLNLKVNRQTLVLGEVGLGGEVRSISKIDARVNSAIKLGFKQLVIPQSQVKLFKDTKANKDVTIVGVKEIKDLLEIFG